MSRIFFIHGTYSSPTIWHEKNKFVHRLSWFFNASYDCSFDWGGNNADDARLAGASKLAERIRKYHKSNPSQKIILVGHSHGGNVAILASNILGDKSNDEQISIDNLITISTPVREYRLNHGNVRVHNNVFNTSDGVQNHAGDNIVIRNKGAHKKIFEAGNSGRQFPGANNIEVPKKAFYGTKDNLAPIIGGPIWGPAGNKLRHMVVDHGSVMDRIDIWQKYVESKLKR